ncbi:hypothetical protein HYPSUDRAFT_202698 [Hypholoma sublateritium FD-334 SS-4]|uniref:Protein CPL1-like domain-containing protein n=1 Tax=Hypholoma sublateritium (strain FD-334 SS-4) TaxID=945553 RepID=A0A0D2NSG6_HYPSF|nr:hypothetical protein HYPSUDRAFT_202698 [Hypholoma sublateritium FD-334 SS-4]
MRLPFSTLVLSATALFSLFPSPVLSIHPHALSRREHGRSPAAHVLTSRQHRIARDLLDVCINANVDLAANASQLLGLGSLLGDLNLGTNVQLCLCLKDLNVYLDTNDDVQALVGLLGKNAVSTIITALINTSPDARQCTFPSNAHHTCNNSDPCHYECDTNYVQNGNTCVCAPPNISCNGVCGGFPQGCGSSVPSLKRAESISTLSQAQSRCKPHETVCGVPGQVGTLAFECVDVQTTEDSCGGCVVPHSFTEASAQSLGKDCTNVFHAKRSTCFESQCIVNSCSEGWIPNSTKDGCIASPGSLSRMRRVQKRGDPLSANVTDTVNVNSDLLTQLVALSKAVVDLSSLTSSSLGISLISTSNTTSSIYALFEDINRATGSLLASSTISQLETNTAALFNISALLASILSTCGCTKTLGLTDASAELQSLVSYLSALTSWYTQNAIVPGSTRSNTGSSSVNSPNQPIVLGLSTLLSDLGRYGTSEIDTIGLSPNDGTNNHANVTIHSDLVTKIIALVNLVIKLHDDASPTTGSPPPQPSTSSSSTDAAGLINPIITSTTSLVISATVASFVNATESLIQACSAANSSLGTYGLEGLAADLEEVTVAALGIQSYYQGHPITTSPTPTAPASLGISTKPTPPAALPPAPNASTSDDAPIVIGLSDLLTGLQLLGPIKANVTVGGLGAGLSDGIDNILDGLDIGPVNARRRDVSANVSAAISSGLRSQLAGLFDLVLALEDSMSSLSTTDSTTSPTLNNQSVLGIVHATGHLLQSSTVGSLLNNIDALINATSALQDQFTACSCTEALGLDKAVRFLDRVSEAAVGLKNWCASNDIVAPTPDDPTTTSLGALLPTGGPLVVESHAILPVASSSPVPADTPIVIGLDNLLDHLGLGGSTGIATVDGLGDGLDSSVNNLLDGVARIGPSGVHRRAKGPRQDLMRAEGGTHMRREKRQIVTTANATLDSTLLDQIDALVDLVLGFNSAASSLLPIVGTSTPLATQAPTISAIGKPTLPSTGSGPVPTPVPSVLSSTSPSCDSSNINSSLVDRIIETTITLLSCQTYDDFAIETNTLLEQSTRSLDDLRACNYTQDLVPDVVYQYLSNIVDASLGLRNLGRENPPASVPAAVQSSLYASTLPTPTATAGTTTSSSSRTSSGDEPLVVGLTKLLNGLGINIKADIVADGLLGNGLDHTLNSVLNGVGIGSNGA